MDHLLQLSTLACQAERLDEAFISSEKSSPSSSSSSSSSRQNSVDDTATPLLTAVSTTTRDGKQTATPKSAAETIMANDRKIIREKIKIAYKKKATTYDALLELCSTYAEDQVYENAPTKLDYYKNGISCCKTIFDLSNQINSASDSEQKAGPSADTPGGTSEDVPRGLKRAKTQH